MPRVLKLFRAPKRGFPMEELSEVAAIQEFGFEGCSHKSPEGKRQVLLVDRETLDALLARGAKLALVSNAPLPGALYARLLARHDLARGFESLQWSYDAGSRKPSPAMLRAALSALGVTPGSAVMVGDRRGSDVAAGRAAGLRTVWLRSEDGGGPPPDRTIDRLVELPGVVAAWT